MRQYQQNPQFYLMRARALVAMELNTRNSIERFKAQLNANTLRADAANYGLALAYLKAGQLGSAAEIMAELLEKDANNLTFHYTAIEIDIARKQYQQAINRLDKLLGEIPITIL